MSDDMLQDTNTNVYYITTEVMFMHQKLFLSVWSKHLLPECGVGNEGRGRNCPLSREGPRLRTGIGYEDVWSDKSIMPTNKKFYHQN